MDEEQRYTRARERVEQLKGFYTHAAVFVLINIGLFIIDFVTGNGWWFYWALIGWGIGLVAHGANTYGVTGVFGADWEERKTREIMEKDEQTHDRGG